MRILIVGFGNSSHVLINRLVSLGHEIFVHSGTFHFYSKIRLIYKGEEFCSMNSPMSFDGCNHSLSEFDLILFTTPSKYSIKFINQNFDNLLRSDCPVGFLYGQGFAPIYFDFLFNKLYKHLSTRMVFSLSSLPWICRVKDPGHLVEVYGVNSYVFYGANNHSCQFIFNDIFSPLLSDSSWGCRFLYNGSLLSASLNCTNQILHPPRFLQLLNDFPEGFLSKSEVPLFYVNVPSFVFSAMERLDFDFLSLKQSLQSKCPHTLLTVMGILELENFQIPMSAINVADLISNDSSLSQIPSPTNWDNGRFKLDRSHRIVFDDIGDGLFLASLLAHFLNVEVPSIRFYVENSKFPIDHDYLNCDSNSLFEFSLLN